MSNNIILVNILQYAFLLLYCMSFCWPSFHHLLLIVLELGWYWICVLCTLLFLVSVYLCWLLCLFILCWCDCVSKKKKNQTCHCISLVLILSNSLNPWSNLSVYHNMCLNAFSVYLDVRNINTMVMISHSPLKLLNLFKMRFSSAFVGTWLIWLINSLI